MPRDRDRSKDKRRRKAMFFVQGVPQGLTDATNLTIIIRWCAENNGSFTLGKEGGRGRGKVGPSRWRVILLDGANSESLGRRGERVLFNSAHADISMIVAKAARFLEDQGLMIKDDPEETRVEEVQRLRGRTLEEILTEG